MAGACKGQTSGKSLSSAAWGSNVGPQTSHWVDLGRWRVISVSSGLWRYNARAAKAVMPWLATALAKGKSAGDHIVVIWHQPYWTSDSDGHGRTTDVKPWVDLLDKYDVRLVLSGLSTATSGSINGSRCRTRIILRRRTDQAGQGAASGWS